MKRTKHLKKIFSERGLDGVLVTDLINVRYLSGFTGSSAFIIITKKHDIFSTDFRYQEQVKNEVKGFSIRIEHSERTREIKDICEKYGVKTLGFEEHNITYGFYKKLLKTRVKLAPLNNLVESLRVIKSREELTSLRMAVRRAESAFRKLQSLIRPGTTERKLALKLEELLKEEGCKKLPFEVIVASGPRSALPHAQPAGRKLKRGDLVVIDWGGEYEGYFSDMTRTILLKGGNISRQKEIYYHVLEAQKKAVSAVKTDMKAADVDAAARNYIEQQGYGDFFGHGTGHGVGLAVHEKPVVSWRSKEMIKENNVFTVEPGIYLPGFGGVRIEDMVVAGKKGVEVLTSLPKKLKII